MVTDKVKIRKKYKKLKRTGLVLVILLVILGVLGAMFFLGFFTQIISLLCRPYYIFDLTLDVFLALLVGFLHILFFYIVTIVISLPSLTILALPISTSYISSGTSPNVL